jgi:hypothetical protein
VFDGSRWSSAVRARYRIEMRHYQGMDMYNEWKGTGKGGPGGAIGVAHWPCARCPWNILMRTKCWVSQCAKQTLETKGLGVCILKFSLISCLIQHFC